MELYHKKVNLKDVIDFLDYEYDAGFGGQECQDILIYTKEKIYYVHEYDGATCIVNIPRHPKYYLKKEKEK